MYPAKLIFQGIEHEFRSHAHTVVGRRGRADDQNLGLVRKPNNPGEGICLTDHSDGLAQRIEE